MIGTILLGVVGAYLLLMGVATNTKNLRSAIVFNWIPYLFGVVSVVQAYLQWWQP